VSGARAGLGVRRRHRRASCEVLSHLLVPISVVVVMLMLPIEVVPLGRWCSLLSSLAASSHHPPCEQWLTGVRGGCRVVRRRCGVLGPGAGLFLVDVGPLLCRRRLDIHCPGWAWGRYMIMT
jgi:hypothetical protein